MNWNRLWSVILASTLALSLVGSGCAKKQVRQEGELASPAQAVEPPAPLKTPVRETPIETRRTETPPARTAADAPAPDKGVRANDMGRETTAGLQRVQFEYDKYALTSTAQDTLKKNAAYLGKNPGMQIRIEGHCDERGTTEYNLALGERRAKAAFQYLIDLGIDPNRMKVVSYGKEIPLDARHNEEAWSKNRRAEFVENQR